MKSAGAILGPGGGARNALKGVTVRVPLGAITAVTGVAGASKASLAFDVLYAEGHRRYAETFSPYAAARVPRARHAPRHSP